MSTCCFGGHHRRPDRLLAQDDFAGRISCPHQPVGPVISTLCPLSIQSPSARLITALRSRRRPARVSKSSRLISAVCLLVSRFEHDHRCLVGMQHRVTQHGAFQGINQRLQLNTAHANPMGQGGARNSIARTGKDVLLPIKRQVI